MKEIDYFTYRGFTRTCIRCGGIEWNVISGYHCEFMCNLCVEFSTKCSGKSISFRNVSNCVAFLSFECGCQW